MLRGRRQRRARSRRLGALWDRIRAAARETEALNLDRKLHVLAIFAEIAAPAPAARKAFRPSFHRRGKCSRTARMSRFYITTAIPYANGAPHIGHAYERIATDAIQRFMRLDGRETLFVTGMDEHGLKMQQTAAREGVTPQAFADRIAAEFEAMGELLNARADDIVRTTQPRHDRASQAIWERMAANGDIYLSKYTGWYSVRDEAYFDESELTDGPDGTKLAPSGAPAEWVEEESYFFRLSAYADRLLAHYEAHPDFVTPEKYRNEIVAFVKRGLSDLSISRTDLRLGRAGAGRSEACDVCLGRRADQLHHRDRLSRRRPARQILAGRRACDRQGHHALPLRSTGRRS